MNIVVGTKIYNCKMFIFILHTFFAMQTTIFLLNDFHFFSDFYKRVYGSVDIGF